MTFMHKIDHPGCHIFLFLSFWVSIFTLNKEGKCGPGRYIQLIYKLKNSDNKIKKEKLGQNIRTYECINTSIQTDGSKGINVGDLSTYVKPFDGGDATTVVIFSTNTWHNLEPQIIGPTSTHLFLINPNRILPFDPYTLTYY